MIRVTWVTRPRHKRTAPSRCWDYQEWHVAYEATLRFTVQSEQDNPNPDSRHLWLRQKGGGASVYLNQDGVCEVKYIQVDECFRIRRGEARHDFHFSSSTMFSKVSCRPNKDDNGGPCLGFGVRFGNLSVWTLKRGGSEFEPPDQEPPLSFPADYVCLSGRQGIDGKDGDAPTDCPGQHHDQRNQPFTVPPRNVKPDKELKDAFGRARYQYGWQIDHCGAANQAQNAIADMGPDIACNAISTDLWKKWFHALPDFVKKEFDQKNPPGIDDPNAGPPSGDGRTGPETTHTTFEPFGPRPGLIVASLYQRPETWRIVPRQAIQSLAIRAPVGRRPRHPAQLDRPLPPALIRPED